MKFCCQTCAMVILHVPLGFFHFDYKPHSGSMYLKYKDTKLFPPSWVVFTSFSMIQNKWYSLLPLKFIDFMFYVGPGWKKTILFEEAPPKHTGNSMLSWSIPWGRCLGNCFGCRFESLGAALGEFLDGNRLNGGKCKSWVFFERMIESHFLWPNIDEAVCFARVVMCNFFCNVGPMNWLVGLMRVKSLAHYMQGFLVQHIVLFCLPHLCLLHSIPKRFFLQPYGTW